MKKIKTPRLALAKETLLSLTNGTGDPNGNPHLDSCAVTFCLSDMTCRTCIGCQAV